MSPLFMKGLRFKIFLIIVGYSMVSVLMLFITWRHFNSKAEIADIGNQFRRLSFEVFKDLNNQENFFIYEPQNQEFFQTGQSEYFSSHLLQVRGLNQEFQNIENQLVSLGYENDSLLQNCQIFLLQSSGSFQASVSIMEELGGAETGAIGKMNSSFEAIMSLDDKPTIELLKLRELEKNYLLSNDEKDKVKVLSKIETLLEQNSKGRQNNSDFADWKLGLRRYKNDLNAVIDLCGALGMKSRTGMIGEHDASIKTFLNYLNLFESDLNKWQKVRLERMNQLFYGLIAVYLLMSVYFGFILSKRTASGLYKLNKHILAYISNHFESTDTDELESIDDEVSSLSRSFILLETELREHLDTVQMKVDERTHELQLKHEELTSVMEKMKYAQRIQNAMLPSEMEMNHSWKDHFVLYKAKDIVSGDFYWSYNSKTWKSTKQYFALGDCTGHGVPGAFMSVLGANTLNDIMRKSASVYPYEILVELNSRLCKSLRRTGINGVTDGMDIGICMIDEEKQLLYFSGALISLVYIKDGVVLELEPDRASIGGEFAKDGFVYNQHVLPLDAMENIYMFSDGIVDQFGGPKGKKLKKKNLKEILLECQGQTMVVQKERINEAFDNWKGLGEQIDDISMFGLNVDFFKKDEMGRHKDEPELSPVSSTFDLLNQMVSRKKS